MKLIIAIKRALGITPAERIDNAINRAANLAADAAKQETKVRLYEAALEHVDPHQEWNVFAHFKQKLYDAGVEHEYRQTRHHIALDAAQKVIAENISPFHVDETLLQETAR